ncbi:STAS-like domain-containing protein [Roseateles cavernae]|uniref:STAS-like domain-containing protein n=1 Tax=Roseateles cavernae TaxID=3153578 RepID=UPI0032E45191
MSDAQIYRIGNRLVFDGQFLLSDLLRPLVGLHQAVQDAGYSDLIIDFSKCTAAFAGPMLALCAQIMRLRAARVDTELILPTDEKLARLFRNANWAYFIEPRNYAPSEFRGHTQVPATHFSNADEQQRAVNKIINAILGAIPDLDRRELSALEWSVNEVTDNVLNHSQSAIGGLVQVSTFQRSRKRVEYIVADAGVGIPSTLRATHPLLSSDAAALEQAIREGVTRDKNVGQGNGLFGSYQICSHSNGFFQLESGYGKLMFTDRDGLRIGTERVPYEGTLVAAQIDFSVPRLLEEALSFGGKAYQRTDYVELRYEQHGTEELVFKLLEESPSFGSRVAGAPVRKRLLNLANMCPGRKIALDFNGVPLVSSSFADEVVGKLFAELGPLTFMQRFELRNIEQTVRQLVDRAIAQRMASG